MYLIAGLIILALIIIAIIAFFLFKDKKQNGGSSNDNGGGDNGGGGNGGGGGGGDKLDPTKHNLVIKNSCPFNLDMASQPNKGIDENPNKGGWKLKSGDKSTVSVSKGWGGRVWARTGCVFNDQDKGNCATGQCGPNFDCKGKGGDPPATVLEFTFDADTDPVVDFYDLSLVDGYNLPASLKPISSTTQITDSFDPKNKFVCGAPKCNSDVLKNCPDELQVKLPNEKGEDVVVGCLSPCKAGVEPNAMYCCDSPYNCSPHSESCDSGEIPCDPENTWDVNYTKIFKDACPMAYSYPYDDPDSTFTCQSKDDTLSSYEIEFCPNGVVPETPPKAKQTYSSCPDGSDCDPNACQCCPDGSLCPNTNIEKNCPNGENPCTTSENYRYSHDYSLPTFENYISDYGWYIPDHYPYN